MADQNPDQDRQDRKVEVPGDTNSADIVGRTGEEMPVQSHDGIESEERDLRTRVDKGSDPFSATRKGSDPLEPVRADDDNPTGRIAD